MEKEMKQRGEKRGEKQGGRGIRWFCTEKPTDQHYKQQQ